MQPITYVLKFCSRLIQTNNLYPEVLEERMAYERSDKWNLGEERFSRSR